MRLFEFADAKASLELWKLVTDSMWKAISVQAQEQERLEQEQALKQKKKQKAAPKVKLPPKPPTITSPQPSKAKKTSAQELQSQKVQSNSVKSKPKTVLPSSSRDAAVSTKNQSNPLSINQTEKMLDPFSHRKAVKDLTN